MHLPESGESEPLIGRDAEVAQLAQAMDDVLPAKGM